jgi:hypothetical protein
MKKKEQEGNRARGVISLKDLIPRQDPKGGAAGRRKTVFGEGPVVSVPDAAERTGKKSRAKK